MTDSPLRVLAVTNMYPTAADPAYGAFVASQMQSVQEAGHAVHVEFINGRLGPAQYLRAIPRLRRLARTGSFDLVHAHYGLSGFAATFQRLPVVVSFCGDDLLGTPDRRGGLTAKSRLARRLSRLAARRAAAIICKSDGLRAALPRPGDRERAHVIANGVDTRLFRPGDRLAARAALGLPSEERLILFPHTAPEVRKRLDLAEAAVAALGAVGVPARLWRVAREPHHRMPLYYQAADCLLLTSDWEGSPNAVKEALCCDLPVVSVDAGDAWQWIALAPGAVAVERRAAAIGAGLAAVLAGPGRADGTAVRERLDLRRVVERVTEAYAEALGRSRGRP